MRIRTFSGGYARVGAAACAFLLMGSVAWADQPPVGEWETTVTRGDRTFTSTLSFRHNDEGELVGTWTTQRGETELRDVSFEDGQLSFTRRMGRGDRTFESSFTGRVEGGYRLVGTFSSPRGERPFTATLRDGAEPFLGEWEITQRFGDREFTSTLSIERGEGGLAGTWTTPRGEGQLEDVKISDGQLSFVRHVRFQDQEFEIAFEGRVEDGNLLGTLTTPRGETEVTGERPEPEEAEEADADDAEQAEAPDIALHVFLC